MERLSRLLREKITGSVRTDEPLYRHTSFRIGGPADLFVEPENTAELLEVLQLLKEEKVPYFILGNGTNLLVCDRGFRGAVIRLAGEFATYFFHGDSVDSGASVPLAVLARAACDRGFGNLVFATGIPGTLGGAVFMNAGAHGRALGDFLITATVLDQNLRLHTLAPHQLGLSYRESSITAGTVICRVKLWLQPAAREEIEQKCREYLGFRQAKQPRQPSAGSIFKNPPGDAAGRLLEAAGLKGRRVGGAMISELHANFIVNCGGASAADVLALIEAARDAVRQKFGVALELEIQVLGE